MVGVVQDFHVKSLHEKIEPLMMVLERNGGLIVKVKTADIAGLLISMKNQWSKFNIDESFNYTFVDESFNKTHITEQKTGSILGIFAGLTIFIACLGLFGLVTFIAEQRIKEIGIRKVLGASVFGIVSLLSKSFIKLVVVSIILASPIAYYVMNRWLQDFAFRINIEWWVFVVAGVSAVVIALLTVSYQAIKAALMNPVKSLKTE